MPAFRLVACTALFALVLLPAMALGRRLRHSLARSSTSTGVMQAANSGDGATVEDARSIVALTASADAASWMRATKKVAKNQCVKKPSQRKRRKRRRSRKRKRYNKRSGRRGKQATNKGGKTRKRSKAGRYKRGYRQTRRGISRGGNWAQLIVEAVETGFDLHTMYKEGPIECDEDGICKRGLEMCNTTECLTEDHQQWNDHQTVRRYGGDGAPKYWRHCTMPSGGKGEQITTRDEEVDAAEHKKWRMSTLHVLSTEICDPDIDMWFEFRSLSQSPWETKCKPRRIDTDNRPSGMTLMADVILAIDGKHFDMKLCTKCGECQNYEEHHCEDFCYGPSLPWHDGMDEALKMWKKSESERCASIHCSGCWFCRLADAEAKNLYFPTPEEYEFNDFYEVCDYHGDEEDPGWFVVEEDVALVFDGVPQDDSPLTDAQKCHNLYCNVHSDLTDNFCGSENCGSAATAAMCFAHWEKFGREEGRAGNPEKCLDMTLIRAIQGPQGTETEMLPTRWEKCYLEYCNEDVFECLEGVGRVDAVNLGKLESPHFVSSLQACQDRCQANPKCVGLTFADKIMLGSDGHGFPQCDLHGFYGSEGPATDRTFVTCAMMPRLLCKAESCTTEHHAQVCQRAYSRMESHPQWTPVEDAPTPAECHADGLCPVVTRENSFCHDASDCAGDACCVRFENWAQACLAQEKKAVGECRARGALDTCPTRLPVDSSFKCTTPAWAVDEHCRPATECEWGCGNAPEKCPVAAEGKEADMCRCQAADGEACTKISDCTKSWPYDCSPADEVTSCPDSQCHCVLNPDTAFTEDTDVRDLAQLEAEEDARVPTSTPTFSPTNQAYVCQSGAINLQHPSAAAIFQSKHTSDPLHCAAFCDSTPGCVSFDLEHGVTGHPDPGADAAQSACRLSSQESGFLGLQHGSTEFYARRSRAVCTTRDVGDKETNWMPQDVFFVRNPTSSPTPAPGLPPGGYSCMTGKIGAGVREWRFGSRFNEIGFANDRPFVNWEECADHCDRREGCTAFELDGSDVADFSPEDDVTWKQDACRLSMDSTGFRQLARGSDGYFKHFKRAVCTKDPAIGDEDNGWVDAADFFVPPPPHSDSLPTSKGEDLFPFDSDDNRESSMSDVETRATYVCAIGRYGREWPMEGKSLAAGSPAECARFCDKTVGCVAFAVVPEAIDANGVDSSFAKAFVRPSPACILSSFGKLETRLTRGQGIVIAQDAGRDDFKCVLRQGMCNKAVCTKDPSVITSLGPEGPWEGYDSFFGGAADMSKSDAVEGVATTTTGSGPVNSPNTFRRRLLSSDATVQTGKRSMGTTRRRRNAKDGECSPRKDKKPCPHKKKKKKKGKQGRSRRTSRNLLMDSMDTSSSVKKRKRPSDGNGGGRSKKKKFDKGTPCCDNYKKLSDTQKKGRGMKMFGNPSLQKYFSKVFFNGATKPCEMTTLQKQMVQPSAGPTGKPRNPKDYKDTTEEYGQTLNWHSCNKFCKKLSAETKKAVPGFAFKFRDDGGTTRTVKVKEGHAKGGKGQHGCVFQVRSDCETKDDEEEMVCAYNAANEGKEMETATKRESLTEKTLPICYSAKICKVSGVWARVDVEGIPKLDSVLLLGYTTPCKDFAWDTNGDKSETLAANFKDKVVSGKTGPIIKRNDKTMHDCSEACNQLRVFEYTAEDGALVKAKVKVRFPLKTHSGLPGCALVAERSSASDDGINCKVRKFQCAWRDPFKAHDAAVRKDTYPICKVARARAPPTPCPPVPPCSQRQDLSKRNPDDPPPRCCAALPPGRNSPFHVHGQDYTVAITSAFRPPAEDSSGKDPCNGLECNCCVTACRKDGGKKCFAHAKYLHSRVPSVRAKFQDPVHPTRRAATDVSWLSKFHKDSITMDTCLRHSGTGLGRIISKYYMWQSVEQPDRRMWKIGFTKNDRKKRYSGVPDEAFAFYETFIACPFDEGTTNDLGLKCMDTCFSDNFRSMGLVNVLYNDWINVLNSGKTEWFVTQDELASLRQKLQDMFTVTCGFKNCQTTGANTDGINRRDKFNDGMPFEQSFSAFIGAGNAMSRMGVRFRSGIATAAETQARYFCKVGEIQEDALMARSVQRPFSSPVECLEHCTSTPGCVAFDIVVDDDGSPPSSSDHSCRLSEKPSQVRISDKNATYFLRSTRAVCTQSPPGRSWTPDAEFFGFGFLHRRALVDFFNDYFRVGKDKAYVCQSGKISADQVLTVRAETADPMTCAKLCDATPTCTTFDLLRVTDSAACRLSSSSSDFDELAPGPEHYRQNFTRAVCTKDPAVRAASTWAEHPRFLAVDTPWIANDDFFSYDTRYIFSGDYTCQSGALAGFKGKNDNADNVEVDASSTAVGALESYAVTNPLRCAQLCDDTRGCVAFDISRVLSGESCRLATTAKGSTVTSLGVSGYFASSGRALCTNKAKPSWITEANSVLAALKGKVKEAKGLVSVPQGLKSKAMRGLQKKKKKESSKETTRTVVGTDDKVEIPKAELPPAPHDLKCAADHGTSTPCCGQKPGTRGVGQTISPKRQCPKSHPVCVGFVGGVRLGTCTRAQAETTPAPHDLKCAADHGTSTPCCGQKPGTRGVGESISPKRQCPKSHPVCVGFVGGVRLGTCTIRAQTETTPAPHDLKCAADHGTSTPCCGQKPGTRGVGQTISPKRQCPKSHPVCIGFVGGVRIGKCITMQDAKRAWSAMFNPGGQP